MSALSFMAKLLRGSGTRRTTNPSVRPRPRPAGGRLSLESLEDRNLLSLSFAPAVSLGTTRIPSRCVWATSGRHYSAGYSAVGGVMLALTAGFLVTRPRCGQASATAEATGPRVGAVEALREPAVLLQMAVFFLYTGLEMRFTSRRARRTSASPGPAPSS